MILLYPLFEHPSAHGEKSVTPLENKRVKNKGKSQCVGSYRKMERSKEMQRWKRMQKYVRKKRMVRGTDVRIGEIKTIDWEWEEDRPLEIISFQEKTLQMSKPLLCSLYPSCLLWLVHLAITECFG